MTDRLEAQSSAEAGLETRLFRGIFFVALATLLFEISLIRVLSFTIWYHFAYVAISTALLGFGASGTLLALRPSIGAHDLPRTLARLSLAAAVSAGFALGFVAFVPLDPLEVFSSARQALVLVAYEVVVTLPFFFAGLVVSLAMRRAALRVDRLYFWDLLGGGLGCAAAVWIMNQVGPPGAVCVAAAALALAAAIFAPRAAPRGAALGLVGLLLCGAPFAGALPFSPPRSKDLWKNTNVFGMETVFTRWTALFRTDVTRGGHGVPPGDWTISRAAPGVTRRACCFVQHDGTAGTAIWDLREGPLDLLDYSVLRIPYLVVKPNPRVMVIGVGGGVDVLNAVRRGASHVTGVELDPVTVKLIRDDSDDVTQGFFRQPSIELVAAEGRHFAKTTRQRFDILQITGVDTLAAQSSGAYVLAENYLYTTEAFQDYFDVLTPGGVLSITTAYTSGNHPRSTGRMISVAREALRERGIENPARHIAVVFSGNFYAGTLIRLRPFSDAEIAALDQTRYRYGFKPLYLPGRDRLGVFGDLVLLDGEERERMLSERQFLIDAVSDDRPFFFRSFRWRDLLRVDDFGPAHTTALGQMVLIVLLLSLTALGGLVVLAPLLAFRRRRVAAAGRVRFGILGYFLAVGLGFMLFEISLLQRFVLYLGYPTYSLSVVLFSLLVFLGCGSFLSRRWVGRERVVLPVAVGALALLTAFYQMGFPAIQEATLGGPLALRVVVSVAVLAPLGLVLGIFFPLGIRRAERVHADLVPWAWAINGCASVTATVLAVVLAMTWGFGRVWLLSLLIYAIGVAALLATQSRPGLRARAGAT